MLVFLIAGPVWKSLAEPLDRGRRQLDFIGSFTDGRSLARPALVEVVLADLDEGKAIFLTALRYVLEVRRFRELTGPSAHAGCEPPVTLASLPPQPQPCFQMSSIKNTNTLPRTFPFPVSARPSLQPY